MTSATNDETTGGAAGPAAAATVELTEDALVAAAQVVPAGSPVVMVNLLRFREVADYGGDAERGVVPAGASGLLPTSTATCPRSPRSPRRRA